MKDNVKTSAQQMSDVEQLRQRIAELEKANSELLQAEEELRASKEDLEAIFNDVRDGIILLDMTGKIIKINERITDATGYTEKDLLGKRFSLLKMFTPKSMSKMLAGFTKTLAGKQSPYEVEGYTKTGEKRIAEIHGSLLRKRGKVVGVITVMRDITEHKRAEEALRESEEKYGELINGMNDTAWVIDFNGKFIDVNNAAVEILGYSREKLLSMGPQDIDTKLDAKEIIGLIKRMAKDKLQVFETIHNTKDGKTIPVEIKSTLVTYKGQQAILSIARDITDRKLAEEALRESAEKYHIITSTAMDGFAVADVNGRILDVNEESCRMLGYSRDEQLTMSILDIEAVETPEEIKRHFQKVIETGSDRFETRHRRKDGRIIDIEVSMTFMPQSKLFLIFHRDITDRKQADKRIRESEERYRAFYEDNPSMYFTVDSEGIVLSVNQFGAEQMGYTVKELVGQPVLNVFYEEDKEAVKQQLAICIQNPKKLFHWEFRKVRKDGKIIWVKETVRAIQTVDGNLVVLIVCEDITERKRADEKLKANFDTLSKSLESTVSALASALEMRDPYTAGHQQRVTDLACAIADDMGLGVEQIAGIRMAGLIHDIGKINIPAEILNKPGQLTELEYSLFKNHPQIGHDVLKTIEFPWPVAQIVLQHHERFDGSGYPQGLAGEEILLEARILAVADIVEAIASHRPYRPARGIGDALEEILHNKGTLYDPEVVDACLRAFYEKGFTFEELANVEATVPKIH